MRHLEFHEKKLLKKVSIASTSHEVSVLSRYNLKRQEYSTYNTLVGQITSLANKISLLPNDEFRAKITASLLTKLAQMGLISTASHLSDAQKLNVSKMARRRLSSILVSLKMAQTVTMSSQYIRQGHVRVGPETVTDPAFLVSRHLADFVTWTDASKIKRSVQKYNNNLDDFDLLE